MSRHWNRSLSLKFLYGLSYAGRIQILTGFPEHVLEDSADRDFFHRDSSGMDFLKDTGVHILCRYMQIMEQVYIPEVPVRAFLRR